MYQFQNNKLFPVTFLRVNTIKGNADASAVDLLRLNNLRGTKAALLTPIRYNEQPSPFYMGPPQGWTQTIKQSLELDLPITMNWPTLNTRDSVSSKYPNTDENMIQSVWIANETLSCVFDISSQSKQKLWSKLRCKIVKIYSN